MNRVFDRGMPVDMSVNRFVYGLMTALPTSVLNCVTEAIVNKRFDHAAYGLKPDHRFNAQHPTVNDDLPNRIACGSVKVKSNIKRLTKTGVEFDDGTYEDNIDAVVYATGYVFGFPFIDEEIIKVVKNRVRLFKYVFPPDLKPATLAVIGCFQPLGAVMPGSEMQCRWASGVFKVSIVCPIYAGQRNSVLLCYKFHLFTHFEYEIYFSFFNWKNNSLPPPSKFLEYILKKSEDY